MNEDLMEEMNIGLSDDEKTDLEEMITVFRNNKPGTSERNDSKSNEEKIHELYDKLSEYSEILLKFDKKLKVLYEILRLSEQKNRITNQRFNAILELLKRQNLMNEK